MPDITMCEGVGCVVKESCYRFTAIPNELRQSYFVDSPIEEGKCSSYWGENSQSIWDQLTDIVKPRLDKCQIK